MSDFQVSDRRNSKLALALFLLFVFALVVAVFAAPLVGSSSRVTVVPEEARSPVPVDDLALADVLPHEEEEILAAMGVARAFAAEYGRMDWEESREEYYERLGPLATEDLLRALPNRPLETDRFLAVERERSVISVTTGAETIRYLAQSSIVVIVPIAQSSPQEEVEETTVAITLVPEENSTWLVDDVQPSDAGNLGEAPVSEG